MSGLDATGLTVKDLETIRTEMADGIKARLGVGINTESDSVIAQLYEPASEQMFDLWQAIQSVHNSIDPDQASDEALDRICAAVGVERLNATRSFVANQYFIGENGTIIPAGSIIEVDGTRERFNTENSVSISLAECISATVEVTTVSNNTAYNVSVDGTAFEITSDADATAEEIADALVTAINGDAFLAATATDNLDGTFVVTSDDSITEIPLVFGPGLTTNSVTSLGSIRAQNFGPIQAPTGTLTNIITPVVGWDSTTNPLDAVLGRNLETDPDLRVRRSQSLAIAGQSTVPAIRSKIAQIEGVTAAIVIENDTNVADGDGRPAKSFEAIISGGDTQDIVEVIYNNKPAGIETFGTSSDTYIDSEGIARIIEFSRPTDIYLHVKISYSKYNEETFPASGETAISQTVLATGNALTIGNDVLPERFKGPIFTAVSGIAELTVEIATSAGPLDPPGAYQTTPLAIAATEVAVFDSSRISVIEV